MRRRGSIACTVHKVWRHVAGALHVYGYGTCRGRRTAPVRAVPACKDVTAHGASVRVMKRDPNVEVCGVK